MSSKPIASSLPSRSVLFLAVLAVAFLLIASPLGENARAFSQETTLAAQPPTRAAPARKAQWGLYMNPGWLLFLLVCLALWIYAASWVCDDAMAAGMHFHKWNTIVLVVGACGMALTMLVDVAMGFVMLLSIAVVLAVYVRGRNKKMPEQFKLFGRDHLRGIFAKLHLAAAQELEVEVEPAKKQELDLAITLMVEDGTPLETVIKDSENLQEAASAGADLIALALQAHCSSLELLPSRSRLKPRVLLDGERVELEPFERELGSRVLSCLARLHGKKPGEKARSSGRFFARPAGQDPVMATTRVVRTKGGMGLVLSFPNWTKDLYLQPWRDLGMSEAMEQRIAEVLKLSKGVLLLSGPPRSGVSTTLHAIATKLDVFTADVVEICDNLEFELDQIQQVELNPSAGVTFSEALARMRREEADVVIRDGLLDLQAATRLFEWAAEEILLLASVEANDTGDALVRLLDMGLDPDYLADSLVCVVNQRLVRKLCESCREPFQPGPALLKKLKIVPAEDETWFKAVGCDRCLDTGYLGRTGIFELLDVGSPLKAALRSGRAEPDALRKAGGKEALTGLLPSGIAKVRAGLTSIEEVRKHT